MRDQFIRCDRIRSITRRAIVILANVCACFASKEAKLYAQSAAPFQRELGLPVRGLSQRITLKPKLAGGKSMVLFDEQGPGCIPHWWLTCSPGKAKGAEHEYIHDLRLRFFYDGQLEPAIDMTLAQYFAIL